MSTADLLDGAPLEAVVRPTQFANLDAVPASPDLAGSAAELGRRDASERYLADALAPARARYDFVFLDCPPSLGPLTVNALAAADRVLVPVQAEYYAMEGLAQLLQTISVLRARLNPELAVAGVVLTMVDARTRLSADVAEELQRHLGDLLFRARVPRSVRLAEAPSHGLPVIHYDRRSAGAGAYWDVANELIERVAEHRADAESVRARGRAAMSEPARRGLGRGFEVLIGGGSEPQLMHMPVEMIHANPRQPRRRFEQEATSGLAESVKAQGLIQPVVVRQREAGGYELIAGERRWRAAQEAGLPTVPAIVREADDRDALLLGLVENVAREQLSVVEEARAYAVLVDEFDLSLGEVSERVAKAKPTVSNRLRLLELPDDVLAMVERGELTEGHARAVLAVPDHEGRRRLARQIVRTGMSVRNAERAARWAGAKQQARRAAARPSIRRWPSGSSPPSRTPPAASATVRAGHIEIPFTDKWDLAELAEALERAGHRAAANA